MLSVLASARVSLISHSVEQTMRLGARLGQCLTGGDVICLSGDLGAGKTALASGIGRGWGTLELINSPTFVFVHEHHRPGDALRLYHVDCYRLNSIDDAENVGFEDILAGDDVTVIEWPERIEVLLPRERLWIDLEARDESTERQLTFQATGRRFVDLLDDFRRSTTGE
jgi:tRNA threonylcarbamoyladenosine biosynthesis protein TsaE